MKAIFGFILFFLSAYPQAQNVQKNELLVRFKPNPGDFLRIVLMDKETETATTNPVTEKDPLEKENENSAVRNQSVTDKEIGYDWKIQEPDANGNTVISSSFSYIRVVQKIGRKIRIIGSLKEVLNEGADLVLDTRQEMTISNPFLNELYKMPPEQQPKSIIENIAILEKALEILKKALIGRPFTMVISPDGKLLEVHDMNLLMDQYRDEIGSIKTTLLERAMLDKWIESFFGEDNISKTIKMILLLPYPEPATKSGENWSDKIDFDLSGLQITMTRRLKINTPQSGGKLFLSGSVNMQFQKEGLLFDPPEAVLTLNAGFDPATGMYDSFESEGDLKFAIKPKLKSPGADSIAYFDLYLYRKAVVTKIGHWDSMDKQYWVFDDNDLRFRIRLKNGWTPEIWDNTNNPSRSILKDMHLFIQTLTQASFISGVSSIKKNDLLLDLSQTAKNLKAVFEKDGKTRAEITLNKVFNTGSIRWQRCRMEIKETSGEQRTYWEQTGYGSNKYSFELTIPGPPSEVSDREVTEMLNRIETQENYWPGFKQSDLIGEWTSNIKTENSVTGIKYIFQKDGSLLWQLKDSAFQHEWPMGLKGKYKLRSRLFRWELDIDNFESTRLKGFSFQCILNPVGIGKIRLEGRPISSGKGERPKDFSKEALIFSKIN
jgi:hypothetical protein